MKNWLNKIRTPQNNVRTGVQVGYIVLSLLLGICLGVFAKWLDNLSINDAVWWQHVLGMLDLRNVFSRLAIWLLIALAISVYSPTPFRAALHVFLFFAGMCVSYHLYTIAFSGFNPRSYMKIWYGLTVVSPIFGFLCWYGKGKHYVSLILDILILGVMLRMTFSVGFWYFDFHGVIDTLIFIGAATVLYSRPKYTVLGILGGLVTAFLL